MRLAIEISLLVAKIVQKYHPLSQQDHQQHGELYGYMERQQCER